MTWGRWTKRGSTPGSSGIGTPYWERRKSSTPTATRRSTRFGGRANPGSPRRWTPSSETRCSPRSHETSAAPTAGETAEDPRAPALPVSGVRVREDRTDPPGAAGRGRRTRRRARRCRPGGSVERRRLGRGGPEGVGGRSARIPREHHDAQRATAHDRGARAHLETPPVLGAVVRGALLRSVLRRPGSPPAGPESVRPRFVERADLSGRGPAPPGDPERHRIGQDPAHAREHPPVPALPPPDRRAAEQHRAAHAERAHVRAARARIAV